jgi:hypothetical protein
MTEQDNMDLDMNVDPTVDMPDEADREEDQDTIEEDDTQAVEDPQEAPDGDEEIQDDEPDVMAEFVARHRPEWGGIWDGLTDDQKKTLATSIANDLERTGTSEHDDSGESASQEDEPNGSEQRTPVDLQSFESVSEDDIAFLSDELGLDDRASQILQRVITLANGASQNAAALGQSVLDAIAEQNGQIASVAQENEFRRELQKRGDVLQRYNDNQYQQVVKAAQELQQSKGYDFGDAIDLAMARNPLKTKNQNRRKVAQSVSSRNANASSQGKLSPSATIPEIMEHHMKNLR